MFPHSMVSVQVCPVFGFGGKQKKNEIYKYYFVLSQMCNPEGTRKTSIPLLSEDCVLFPGMK